MQVRFSDVGSKARSGKVSCGCHTGMKFLVIIRLSSSFPFASGFPLALKKHRQTNWLHPALTEHFHLLNQGGRGGGKDGEGDRVS